MICLGKFVKSKDIFRNKVEAYAGMAGNWDCVSLRSITVVVKVSVCFI